MNRNEAEVRVEFGRILAARRKKLDLTQEQLADRCGTARNYIGELERGEKQPTLITLLSLADALEITPVELLRTLQKRL